MRNFFKKWRRWQSKEDAVLHNYSLMQRWMFGLLFFYTGISFSQNQLNITVTDAENKEAIPFANVVLYKEDIQEEVATTNFDGQCQFKNIKQGKYTIKAVYVGYELQKMMNITMGENVTRHVTIELKSSGVKLICCEMIIYCHPTISNGFSSGANYERRNGRLEPCGQPDGAGVKCYSFCDPIEHETPHNTKKPKANRKHSIKLQDTSFIKISPPDNECLGTCLDSIAGAELAMAASIKENTITENALRIYPNPCASQAILKGALPIDEVYILDMSGRLIFHSAQMNQYELNLNTEELKNGFYVVKGKQGNHYITEKLIVQK